jgi:FG-GAP repeat
MRLFRFFTIQSATMKKLSFLHLLLVVALYVSGTLCALSQDWNQILKISNADRTTRSVAGRGSDYFGYSLAIDRNYAVVAAPLDKYDATGNNPLEKAGSVFVFERIGGVWTQIKKIVPDDRALEDRFGESVAIFETTIVVGCPNEMKTPMVITHLVQPVLYIYSASTMEAKTIGDR